MTVTSTSQRTTTTSNAPTSGATTLADVDAGRALLRQGQKGPAVSAMQELLKAHGASIDADGSFGPKTAEALKAFQAQHGLKVDGLCGPQSLKALQAAPSSPEAPSAPTTSPTSPTFRGPQGELRAPTAAELAQAPAGTVRAGTLQDQARVGANGSVGSVGGSSAPGAPGAPGVAGRIVDRAIADEGKVVPGGKDYKGWPYLQGVFENATGWRPADNDIRSDSTPQGKNWCGIWAAHTMKESGVDVSWDLNTGKMKGDVDLKLSYGKEFGGKRGAFEGSVQPGDVIILKGKLNHHAVVTGINGDGTVRTMNGNHPGIGAGTAKLSDVYGYYRAKDATSSAPTVTSTPTTPKTPKTTASPPSTPSSTTPAPSLTPRRGLANTSADKAPAPVPTPLGAGNTEGGKGEGAAGKSVSDRFYADGVTDARLNRSEAFMQQKVNLSGDKQSRMAAMNTFTQFDTAYDVDADANACGATSIVAGAAIDGGTQGLKDLVKVIEDRGNETRIKSTTQGWKDGEIPEWGKLAGIKERINSGAVTQQDLSDMKTIVYRQLRKVEDDIGANSKNSTIDIDAIKAYVNTDVAWLGTEQPLKGMFDRMNIKLVDTTGDGVGNHFVLMFNDGKGQGENALYDPWPTKSGKQITTSGDDMLWYHHGVKNALR